MKKISILILFIWNFLIGQNIHIRYNFSPNNFANVYEDTYFFKDKIISIRDSAMHNEVQNTSTDGSFNYVVKALSSKVYYLKNNKSQQLKFYEKLDGTSYEIIDQLPLIKWSVDRRITKNILGYQCFQGKASFRGSNVTAYFTDKLPSGGPFKFVNLPGAMLYLEEDNTGINRWTAIAIDSGSYDNVEMPKTANKTNMKDFIKLKDAKVEDEFQKMVKKVPQGVTIKRNKLPVTSLEKTFE